MQFIDEVFISVEAGRGGDGAASFRREKFVPRGGPDGGNGGHGGSVVVKADSSVTTLIDLRFQKNYRARSGTHGSGTERRGADGRRCIIHVPPGTLIYDEESGGLIADLVKVGQWVVVAGGGRGGRGSASFKGSTRRAPQFAEKGIDGENGTLRLELKLLADVGIIGIPNAGKSTLISRISAARPKVADYPFTTLAPNLGTVKVDHFSFVVADLPGLIEGAHRGVGLGHQFLRHAERTRLMIHLIDMAPIDGHNPLDDFHAINRELSLFDESVSLRPQIIGANKMDLPGAQKNLERFRSALELGDSEVFPLSAVTGEGIQPLTYRVAERLRELLPGLESQNAGEEQVMSLVEKAERPTTVFRGSDGVFVVEGDEVERAVQILPPVNWGAAEELARRLKRMGVYRVLLRAGCRSGALVRIDDEEFEFEEERG